MPVVDKPTRSSGGDRVVELIARWKDNPDSVYNTWFKDESRLKCFRSIRRGLQEMINEIQAGTFGNDYKGSSLEVVMSSIAEQKQVFRGAEHAFIWKPKLRIPDIYEDEGNKRFFGGWLSACMNTSQSRSLLAEVDKIHTKGIKGLGPAAANVLYFLHPTLFPPFNTAIVNGFRAVFGEKLRLGSWPAYLLMREAMLEFNTRYLTHLSKDLGALAGLLFDIGVGEVVLGPEWEHALEFEPTKLSRIIAERRKQARSDEEEERAHTHIQHLLIKLGLAFGYRVWVAANDHSREWDGEKFRTLCLDHLPRLHPDDGVQDTIRLIDVIWLSSEGGSICCAFEVEKTTSIHSGILRLVDLSKSLSTNMENGAEARSGPCHFYLVVPGSREREVQAQLRRPAFGDLKNMALSYLNFEDLDLHSKSLSILGDDHRILGRIAKHG